MNALLSIRETKHARSRSSGTESRRIRSYIGSVLASKMPPDPEPCLPGSLRRKRHSAQGSLDSLSFRYFPTVHGLCGLATQLAKMHASHSYRYVAPYIFCERCGSYTTDRVRDLGDPCPRKASSSKVAFLRRLLEGCHPRTEVYLGVPHPVDLVALRQELAGRLALRPGR